MQSPHPFQCGGFNFHEPVGREARTSPPRPLNPFPISAEKMNAVATEQVRKGRIQPEGTSRKPDKIDQHCFETEAQQAIFEESLWRDAQFQAWQDHFSWTPPCYGKDRPRLTPKTLSNLALACWRLTTCHGRIPLDERGCPLGLRRKDGSYLAQVQQLAELAGCDPRTINRELHEFCEGLMPFYRDNPTHPIRLFSRDPDGWKNGITSEWCFAPPQALAPEWEQFFLFTPSTAEELCQIGKVEPGLSAAGPCQIGEVEGVTLPFCLPPQPPSFHSSQEKSVKTTTTTEVGVGVVEKEGPAGREKGQRSKKVLRLTPDHEALLSRLVTLPRHPLNPGGARNSVAVLSLDDVKVLLGVGPDFWAWLEDDVASAVNPKAAIYSRFQSKEKCKDLLRRAHQWLAKREKDVQSGAVSVGTLEKWEASSPALQSWPGAWAAFEHWQRLKASAPSQEAAGYLAHHDQEREARAALLALAEAALGPDAETLRQKLRQRLEAADMEEGSLVWKRAWNHHWARFIAAAHHLDFAEGDSK